MRYSRREAISLAGFQHRFILMPKLRDGCLILVKSVSRRGSIGYSSVVSNSTIPFVVVEEPHPLFACSYRLGYHFSTMSRTSTTALKYHHLFVEAPSVATVSLKAVLVRPAVFVRPSCLISSAHDNVGLYDGCVYCPPAHRTYTRGCSRNPHDIRKSTVSNHPRLWDTLYIRETNRVSLVRVGSNVYKHPWVSLFHSTKCPLLTDA